jgi:hypothetical protein
MVDAAPKPFYTAPCYGYRHADRRAAPGTRDNLHRNRKGFVMHKTIGILLCVVAAIVLAWLSVSASDFYWAYMVAAGILGVAAGVIKNLPDSKR